MAACVPSRSAPAEAWRRSRSTARATASASSTSSRARRAARRCTPSVTRSWRGCPWYVVMVLTLIARLTRCFADTLQRDLRAPPGHHDPDLAHHRATRTRRGGHQATPVDADAAVAAGAWPAGSRPQQPEPQDGRHRARHARRAHLRLCEPSAGGVRGHDRRPNGVPEPEQRHGRARPPRLQPHGQAEARWLARRTGAALPARAVRRRHGRQLAVGADEHQASRLRAARGLRRRPDYGRVRAPAAGHQDDCTQGARAAPP